ncbi:MAG TPA: hypothetical protein VF686_01725 [Brevundimonas sp.]|jgi:hypothetical protein
MLPIHAAIALALTGFAPQDPPQVPAAEPTQVDDVLVTGRPLREMVENFVDAVVEPPRGRGPARWDRKVCVGVVNLRREPAQIIIDRVSQVALDVGLEIGEPGCSPNILVLATNDGAGLATALIESRPNAFRPNFAGSSRSGSALERFRTTDSPVRWWHVALPVDSDTGAAAVRMPGEGAPKARTLGGLLRTEVRNDLRRAFVIVDMDEAAGVNFQQLSDYVAMVSFAQIDPDADLTAYQTVLNLFEAPASVGGMTEWDRSYLTALYDAELNQRNPNSQIGAVGGVMIQDREREPAQE